MRSLARATRDLVRVPSLPLSWRRRIHARCAHSDAPDFARKSVSAANSRAVPPLRGVGVLAETFDLAGALARVAAGTAWRSEDPDRKARRADRLCGPAPDGRSPVAVEEI